MKATNRLEGFERVELLRIALANGATERYWKKLMETYTNAAKSPYQIQNRKPVDTQSAFDILRGAL